MSTSFKSVSSGLGIGHVPISVTFPVWNGSVQLVGSVARLIQFLSRHVATSWEVVIAENGSTDGTFELACELAADDARSRVVRIEEQGRGLALRRAWLERSAEVLSYMDVDLSTDLAALPRLLSALFFGEFDVAAGSRLARPEWTTRGLRREVISRCYNRLIKFCFQNHFSDAQCGFKAITRKAAHELLPLVEDDGWFFDTELLVRAENLGYRILDLPVRWVEDPDSRVNIFRTAYEELKGRWRLQRELGGKNGSGRGSMKQVAGIGAMNR